MYLPSAMVYSLPCVCVCVCVCVRERGRERKQVKSGTVGVVRVQYTSDMLEQLIAAIRNDALLTSVSEQVNSGTVGVVRVQYTSDMLEQLIPAIRDRTLPPKDRLGLQNDLYALVSFTVVGVQVCMGTTLCVCKLVSLTLYDANLC